VPPVSSGDKDPEKWDSCLLLILCSLVFKVRIPAVWKFLSMWVSTKHAFLWLSEGRSRRLTAQNCFPYFLLLFTCLKCIFFCDCIYSFPICLSASCLKLSLRMDPHAICRFLSLLPHKPLWTQLLHLFPLIYYSNLKSPEEASSRPLCTLISAHISHLPPLPLPLPPHFCTQSLIFNLEKKNPHFSFVSFGRVCVLCVQEISSLVRIDMQGQCAEWKRTVPLCLPGKLEDGGNYVGHPL